MRSPDLASVVEYLARGRDEDLRRVEAGEVEFGVAQGDEYFVGAGCAADALHLGGVRGEAVLAVGFEEGEAFLVGYFPGPVGVAGDPFLFVSTIQRFV